MKTAPIIFQQQAYEYIKTNILNMKLKPGQYIMDTQIAGELNISRTPVREAFHRIENEGLLVYEQRRGWKVYTLTLKDVHEIFDLKEMIESNIAFKAANCKDEFLRDQLKQIISDMAEVSKAHDSDGWFEADRLLHETLFKMADNQRAYAIFINLNEQWHRLRIGFTVIQGRMERSIAEHQVVVDNILAGNGEEASRLTRLHLINLRTELINLLVNFVLPFAGTGI
jgi:GntR family transcriptional regulator, rspAB operon transcriptional repressor